MVSKVTPVSIRFKAGLRVRCAICDQRYRVEKDATVSEESLVEKRFPVFTDADGKEWNPTHYYCPRCDVWLVYDPGNGDDLSVYGFAEILSQFVAQEV